MKPYDWCDSRCPDPCSCMATIEENTEKAKQQDEPLYFDADGNSATLDEALS